MKPYESRLIDLHCSADYNSLAHAEIQCDEIE